MTNLNPTQHRPNFVTNIVAGWLIGWVLFCLKLLALIPLAVAKGVVALSGEIGNAAGMAYVDPFMSNRKDRN
jgi:hypothetical protein